MIIIFKNGLKQEISSDIAKTLRDRFVEGCLDFQCFNDKDGNLLAIFNVKEILCIVPKS